MDRVLFYPKIFSCLKNYTSSQFFHDCLAGMVVGVVALPLAIAFGIASGVTPQQGIMTAIVAGFLISLLGGSRVQIGGPTGAFIVILYEIIQDYGYEGLFIATIMAGVLLILMGISRLGNWMKFIPFPVVTGFTTGIAVIIFSSQMKDFWGLDIAKVPGGFVASWSVYIHSFSSYNPWSFIIAFMTLTIIALTPRFTSRIPGAIFALVLTTLLSFFLNLPIDTIGSRFGEMNLHFAFPSLPSIHLDNIQNLTSPALSIALLGALESLLCATVADGMIGGRHRPNTELIAQGIANILSPLFGGIPATGAIARTATNVRNGGRTPIAGIIHALTLLILVLVASPLAFYVPMATLAGTLVMVAYNMSEWREFKTILRYSQGDAIVLLITFFSTVFLDLIIAIQLGFTFSALLFMKKISEATHIKKFQDTLDEPENTDSYYDEDALRTISTPPQTAIFEVQGAFFCAAAAKFEAVFETTLPHHRFIIFRMHQVFVLDATAIHLLSRMVEKGKQYNTSILFCELHPLCEQELIETHIPHLHFFKTLHQAINYVHHHV